MSMLETIAIGLITGSARKTLLDPLVEKGLRKRAVEKELGRLIKEALKGMPDECCQILNASPGYLDDQFWESDEVKQELWETLIDHRNAERVPDFNVLWRAYTQSWREDARIKRTAFDQTLEAFWQGFLASAKSSVSFHEHFRDKILFQLDATVFPHEGEQLILAYCRNMVPKLNILHHQFCPKELEGKFPKEQISQEFLQYRRTKLTYVTSRGDSIDLRAEGQVVVGDDFLNNEKVIFFGTGGVGKTRFTFELVRRLITEIVESVRTSIYLPLYLTARQCEGGKLRDIVAEALKVGLDEIACSAMRLDGFVNFLVRHKRLLLVIDAADQITPGKEHEFLRFLASRDVTEGCRVALSTRPFRLGDIIDNLNGLDTNKVKYKFIKMHAFDLKLELPGFFGNNFKKIKPLIEKLNRQEKEGEVNLLQIPLFARLVKIQAMKGRVLQYEVDTIISRKTIMEWFIGCLIDEQVKKDLGSPQCSVGSLSL